MSTVSSTSAAKKNAYPTTDGRPMAETDIHRDDMLELIESLRDYFALDADIYVTGNLLLYYVPGDKRRQLIPDVFVVKGVEKRWRDNYLLWEEGKGPDVVIELTSSSTRAEDTKKKYRLYQDVLKVPEYFLFDPHDDYLEPALQGYRLVKGQYAPIRAILGRLPSKVLGLHLERHRHQVRLFDPRTERWLPTPREATAQAAANYERAEARFQKAEIARLKAETENLRLRLELEALRGAK